MRKTAPTERCQERTYGRAPFRRHDVARASALLHAALLCALALGGACSAFAQEPARPLFQSEAPLAVTLQAPWRELLRKRSGVERYPAVLTYKDEQGRSHALDMTVESRGLTRLRACWFPPIRIRFPDAVTQGTVFEGQRSLKMVTHCRTGQRSEQSYVLEMLAYRIYNLVSDISYRVRPLDITYQDVQRGTHDGPYFAFLIEPLGDMARRTDHLRASQAAFAPDGFDGPALSRYMLFQYLIGNTDWSVLDGPKEGECCHNARILVGKTPAGFIAVPYDLDSAGLVNTNYAAPHESLPIKEVTQRLFRGFCVHNGELPAARDEFLRLRAAIFAMVQDEPRLSASRRRQALRYLQGFYDTLDDPARFEREITGRCRR